MKTKKNKCIIVVLVIILILLDSRNSYQSTNYEYSVIPKPMSPSTFLSESLIFYILSPENDSVFFDQPIFAYYISTMEASLSFWLNGSIVSNLVNNSILPLTYRGWYNLTGVAIFNSSFITHQVIFGYFPDLSINVSYTACYLNTWFHIYGYESDSIPTYGINETITFFVQPNEKNETLNITIEYGVQDVLPLDEGNYTWVNSTTLQITIEPLIRNSPMPSYLVHKMIFNMSSILPNSYNSQNFYFFRNVVPPQIIPFEHENFLIATLSGAAYGHFYIWSMISELVNISIYLDGFLILDEYNKNGFRIEYFTIIIDTTLYSNGNHILEILVTDFFNLTSKVEYILDFFNHESTNSTTETTTTNGSSSLTWLYYLIGFYCLSVLAIFISRRYYIKRKKQA